MADHCVAYCCEVDLATGTRSNLELSWVVPHTHILLLLLQHDAPVSSVVQIVDAAFARAIALVSGQGLVRWCQAAYILLLSVGLLWVWLSPDHIFDVERSRVRSRIRF